MGPYIVAEISGNHNGSLDRAFEIVTEVAAAGAHAIKIQTFTADTITLPVDTPNFRISDDHPLWGGKTLYELYSQAQTPWDWHAPIFNLANKLGLAAFSTPFDESAVDFLETLNVPAYKIASLEIIDLPLIRKVSATGKPVIISTGTASFTEIAMAVEAARQSGCKDLTLLVCTSSYPAEPKDANLGRMKTLSEAFDVKVGLSDHTLGIGVAIAATTLGASLIEKHVTLRRSDGGLDSAFSIEPNELRTLIHESRAAKASLGSPNLVASSSENESARLRPSLYIAENVKAGEIISNSNVRSVRPSGGLPPDEISNILGMKFADTYPMGTPLTRKSIDWS